MGFAAECACVVFACWGLYRLLLCTGSCSAYTLATYNCTCVPGVTGVNCDVNIDECSMCACCAVCVCFLTVWIVLCTASSPCTNNGNCTNVIPGFECTC